MATAKTQREYTYELTLTTLRALFGAHGDLLDSEDVQEIMVNSPTELFVQRNGVTNKVPNFKVAPESINAVIHALATTADKAVGEGQATTGKREERDKPILHAAFGSIRIAAAMPPVAKRGPMICIRRGASRFFSDEQLLAGGFFERPAEVRDEEVLANYEEEAGKGGMPLMAYLQRAVEANQRIVVAGSTGSGKTVYLNRLVGYIPKHERVGILEDTKELAPELNNWFQLEANADVGVPLSDLVAFSLRAAPARIVVGEVRLPHDCKQMISAFNTGHGGMASIHAGSARSTLTRIETLMMQAGGDPSLLAIRGEIATAVNLVVHIDTAYVGDLRQRQRFIGCVMAIEDELDVRTGGYRTRTIYNASDSDAERIKQGMKQPARVTALPSAATLTKREAG